jgi:hypothetical protein
LAFPDNQDLVNEKSQPSIYSYPRLSKTDLLFIRIGGNGLGNLLLTWARCLSASEQNSWKMVWPTWGSFKPKNWRVNPYDHRTYFDLFQPTRRYVSGLKKPFKLARYRWQSEAGAGRAKLLPGTVVEYRGMEGMFAPFLNSQPLVLRELLAMTRKKHLAGYSADSPAPIAIHVRRGDFIKRASYNDMVGSHNSLLPLDWYMNALEAVRAKCGKPLPAFVFSDGEEEELAPLISMPGVSRADYGSGLADMLALARSRLLIASGSTFSMWGSYLGQVPTIWHPGKKLQQLLIHRPELEIEWTPGDSMPDWIGYFEDLRGSTSAGAGVMT